MKKYLTSIGALLAMTLAACGNGQETNINTEGEVLNVVATTTLVADLVNNIGGSRVEAEYLMGPGIDPHYHVASAGDLNRLDSADIIVFHGINLEERMAEIFDNMAEQGRHVISTEAAIDSGLRLFEEEDDEDEAEYDPHIWFDVNLWQLAATHFAEELAEIDPEHADYFQANLEAYLEELRELNTYIEGRVAEVPAESRVLITAHDAFQYFGQAYGFEVLGIQGISTTSEAGTSDIAALADFIVEHNIRSIFVETSVSSRNIEALQEAAAARGHEVEIGGYLYSDALGDAESGTDTYISMMRANINTIVDALK